MTDTRTTECSLNYLRLEILVKEDRRVSDCAIRTPLVSSTERQRQADTSEFQVSQDTQ